LELSVLSKKEEIAYKDCVSELQRNASNLTVYAARMFPFSWCPWELGVYPAADESQIDFRGNEHLFLSHQGRYQGSDDGLFGVRSRGCWMHNNCTRPHQKKSDFRKSL